MNQQKNQGWAKIIGVILTIVVVFLIYIINTTPGQTPSPAPQPTSQYDPAPPDPEKNAPGEDFFDYIKTNVPEEERERVSLASLFSMDAVKMNRYFDQSVYREVNTKIEIDSVYRARAAHMYAALTWPDGWFSRLFGFSGNPLTGAEISTITAGDAFLIIGTNPDHALAGIIDVQVDGNTITVTSQIEPMGLAIGFAISAEENNPQIESAPVVTPNAKLDSWLVVRDQLPSESDLNNMGLKIAAKEALWLMLHKDAPEMWSDIVKSIETPGDGHAYNLLAPFLRQAFCTKLDSFQQELIAQGKNLEVLSCDDPENPVEIIIVLEAVMPTNANGQTGLEFMKILDSGYYVQTPDPDFKVDQ